MEKQKVQSNEQEQTVQFSQQIDKELREMKDKDFSMYLHLKSVLTKILIYYQRPYTEENLENVRQHFKDIFKKDQTKVDAEKESELRLQKYKIKVKQLKDKKCQNKQSQMPELDIMEWLKNRLDFYNKENWNKALQEIWKDIEFKDVLDLLNHTSQDLAKLQHTRFQYFRKVKHAYSLNPIMLQQTVLFLSRTQFEHQNITIKQIEEIAVSTLSLIYQEQTFCLYKSKLIRSTNGLHQYQIEYGSQKWECIKASNYQYSWFYGASKYLQEDIIDLIKFLWFNRQSKAIEKDSNRCPSIVINLSLLPLVQDLQSLYFKNDKLSESKRQQIFNQLAEQRKIIKKFIEFCKQISEEQEKNNKVASKENLSKEEEKNLTHQFKINQKIFINFCTSRNDQIESKEDANHVIQFGTYAEQIVWSKQRLDSILEQISQKRQKLINSLSLNQWMINKKEQDQLKSISKIIEKERIEQISIQVKIKMPQKYQNYYLKSIKQRIQQRNNQTNSQQKIIEKGIMNENRMKKQIHLTLKAQQSEIDYYQIKFQLVKKKYNTKQAKENVSQTGWIMYRTRDGRCFWAANIDVDIEDVQLLLRFLLTRSEKQSEFRQCPSIAISSGMHGKPQHKGKNLFHDDQKTLKQNLDKRLIWQVKCLVHDLSRQNTTNKTNDLLIDEQNVGEKIYVNEFGVNFSDLYKQYKTDHIIDTRCAADQLYLMQHNYFVFFDYISKFDQQANSQIIETKQQWKLILRLFQKQGKQFTPIKLFQKIKDFYDYYQTQNLKMKDILFLVKSRKVTTEQGIYIQKYMIFGGYSPQSHHNEKKQQLNQQAQSYNDDQFVSDQTKKSFLFSIQIQQKLNQISQEIDQNFKIIKKYGLKESKKAIKQSKDKHRICFGQEQFILWDPNPDSMQNDIRVIFRPNNAYKQTQTLQLFQKGLKKCYKKIKSQLSQFVKYRGSQANIEMWLMKEYNKNDKGQNNIDKRGKVDKGEGNVVQQQKDANQDQRNDDQGFQRIEKKNKIQ